MRVIRPFDWLRPSKSRKFIRIDNGYVFVGRDLSIEFDRRVKIVSWESHVRVSGRLSD